MAFELLLTLILWSPPGWFRDFSTPRQLASPALLTISLALAVEGFRLLRKIGKPRSESIPGANLSFENTTVLVTKGIYRFIRHPMCASLIGLGRGF